MKILPAVCCVAAAVACGGSNGTIKVSLTDAPSDLANVSQVNVTVDEVRVHDEAASTAADGGPDAASDGVDGRGWVVLCSEQRTYDLLGLTNGRFAPLCTQALADGGSEAAAISVPAGRISQVRLHVVSAQLVFNDGTAPVSLTVPSGATSGLKIDVGQDVPGGGTLDLKLDFDAAASITKQGTGTYTLRPVLRVVR
jgi:uncharacterized protein DUF4382